MNLDDWVKNGWLRLQQPSPRDIGDLLDLARRDLKDARSRDLSDDWRFNIAYNAALQVATAALAAAGYTVPKGESHHFRVIESLAATIGLDSAGVVKFD